MGHNYSTGGLLHVWSVIVRLLTGRWNTVLRSDVCRTLRETPAGLPAGETPQLWWRGVSVKRLRQPHMCERAGNKGCFSVALQVWADETVLEGEALRETVIRSDLDVTQSYAGGEEGMSAR